MTKELEGMKDITLTQNKVTVLGSLNDASRAQIEALADELSRVAIRSLLTLKPPQRGQAPLWWFLFTRWR